MSIKGAPFFFSKFIEWNISFDDSIGTLPLTDASNKLNVILFIQVVLWFYSKRLVNNLKLIVLLSNNYDN